jgi:uncharacterized LabA/DUF88 family protein
MMFVDGENLAIRYGAVLAGRQPQSHITYEPSVLVWSGHLQIPARIAEVVRVYFYTCVAQDEVRRQVIEEQLKSLGVHAPRVFSKVKGKRSKRVDVSLATDMLTHAHRDNYDLAILIAGDEDYVPLVQAVMSEGKRVAVWFFKDGLSRALKIAADHYYDLDKILFESNNELAYLHL